MSSTNDRSHYMSMLSPEEWGDPPDDFMGSYRLEIDQSWTRIDGLADL